MVLLFIGPSGSGKDTQAQLLQDKFDFKILSSGELLRDISVGNTIMETSIRRALNEGIILDQLVYALLQIYLEYSQLKNFILTGFVRSANQIHKLDSCLYDIGTELTKVVYFKLTDEVAIKRMSGRMVDKRNGKIYHSQLNPPPQDAIPFLEKRPDDSVTDSYLKRLREFHRDNVEIIHDYNKRSLLMSVDASKSIEEIHDELIKDLNL